MLIIFQVLFVLLNLSFAKPSVAKIDLKVNEIQSLYDECQLAKVVNYETFKESLAGFEKFHPAKQIITIVDFSLPSTVERFFVIDIAKKKFSDVNKSVNEIAFELGFKYPQHFTRFFKLKVGYTPNEYRKLTNLN